MGFCGGGSYTSALPAGCDILQESL